MCYRTGGGRHLFGIKSKKIKAPRYRTSPRMRIDCVSSIPNGLQIVPRGRKPQRRSKSSTATGREVSVGFH